MKKIFIITGMLAFSFASAQQNDFFDIQKHLQKKFKEEQNQKQKEQLLSFLKPNKIPFLPSSVPQAKLLQILPNGDKVYSLPEDNMPYIVPDMSQFNKADLAGPNFNFKSILPNRNFPGRIPNVITPYKIIPEENK